MSISRMCSRVVATATGNETITKAAERMAELEVGTLVVVSPIYPRKPVGIVTDRDLALRCIPGRLSEETPISAIMSTPVHSVDEHTPMEEAVDLMGRSGTRRLVVTGEDGQLVGVLSLDDVLGVAVEEAAAIGRLIEQQRPKIPA